LGSANDLAELTLVILKDYSHIFEITSKSEAEFFSENGSLYNIKNTNKLISEIASFIAGKTGYSDLAGGNLLIVADMGFNDPYLFVILGSSYEGRFEDVKKLYYAVKGLSF
jgi:D-alanyl-D-alanine carboxypeptidase